MQGFVINASHSFGLDGFKTPPVVKYKFSLVGL